MSLATDFLLDVATEKNGYSLGKPWRFTEFSLAAIVPIIRADGMPRGYRLLSEVKDEVRIKDTGHIDTVELINNGELPVLVKSGEMVAGATQSRALVKSQVLMAGERVTAECACVHSTKGIRGGQQVKPAGISPVEVRRTLYDGYRTTAGELRGTYGYSASLQHDVWSQVNEYSHTMHHSLGRIASFAASADGASHGLSDLAASPNVPYSTPAQDLVGRVTESQDKFRDVLKKIPVVDNQVGIALLTINGVDSLESFSHPDSWDAIRKEILKTESGKIADVGDLESVFEYREEKAKAVIHKLLAAGFEEMPVVEKEHTTTVILDAEKFTGEVVTLYDQPIHCTFVRKAS